MRRWGIDDILACMRPALVMAAAMSAMYYSYEYSPRRSADESIVILFVK